MAALRLKLSTRARSDIAEHETFYTFHSVEARAGFVRALRESLAYIEANANAGTAFGKRSQRLVMAQPWKYVIIFRRST
jgi:plasmid stabilization system protein ParE